MKKTILMFAAIAAVVLLAAVTHTGAQEKTASARVQQWEYAWVKWDGPDKVAFIFPDKFDFVRMEDQGYHAPKQVEEEQYYLCMAANKMAKDGWEPVNLDSRRILFRRSLK
jgi:hypothetical protein